jgi:hypothetical protein
MKTLTLMTLTMMIKPLLRASERYSAWLLSKIPAEDVRNGLRAGIANIYGCGIDD